MDENAPLAYPLVVISCGPLNSFGAGNAHRGYLKALVALGARAFSIGSSQQGRNDFLSDGITHLEVDGIRSDAYPTSASVEQFAQVERMCAVAVHWATQGYEILLLGTYIYPFCVTVLRAATVLRSMGIATRVIVVPAGSDVWQIGAQLRFSTRAVLCDPLVTERVTFSSRFAREIQRTLGFDDPFIIIPPMVNTEHFRPPRSSEKRTMRRSLGLNERDVVLVSCCNMRPVKEVGLTLEIARACARRLTSRVVLLLVGPSTQHLTDLIGKMPGLNGSASPSDTEADNLVVVHAGMQDDPRPFNWCADVAINTSVHDSFNLSLAEAMACGLPILSTDIVGLGDIFQHEEVGLFFPIECYGFDDLLRENHSSRRIASADTVAITEWLVALLADPRAYERLSKAAVSSVEKHLGLNRTVSRWRALLHKTR